MPPIIAQIPDVVPGKCGLWMQGLSDRVISNATVTIRVLLAEEHHGKLWGRHMWQTHVLGLR